MITPQSWPTDPHQCHDLLSKLTQQVDDLQTAAENLQAVLNEQRAALDEQQAALDQAAKLHQAEAEDLRTALDQAAKLHDQAVSDRDQTIEELRRQIELYRRYVFGPRRERLVDAPDRKSTRLNSSH